MEGQTSPTKDEEMDFDKEAPTREQLAKFEELEKRLEETVRQSEQIESEPKTEEETTIEQSAQSGLEKQIKEKAPEIQTNADSELLHDTSVSDKVTVSSGDVLPSKSDLVSKDIDVEQQKQIATLVDKIKDLETALVNASELEQESKSEPTTVEEMIERFDDTENEQIRQLEILEEQIEKTKDYNIGSVLVKKLHKQVDKLDAIAQRIASSWEATQEQIDRVEELEKQIAELEEKKKRADAVSEIVAYCMRCKKKQNMSSPEKVTMKNGKPATRGICSVCGTKMFKIGGPTSKPKGDNTPTRDQIARVAKLEKQIADLESRQ